MSTYYMSRGDARFVFHAEHVKDDAIERGNMRPVTVIDPEDREAVERLGRALVCEVSEVLALDDEDKRLIRSAVPAALREFAAPTPAKPEEPTGLGAVVEDDEGFQWVRIDDRRWYCEARGYRHYAEIDVVGEPLSEGVTA